MTNIALIGYGKMGRLVERVAVQRGHRIAAIVDPACENAARDITEDSVGGADVCVDFTRPDAVLDNIRKAAALRKHLVVGATGWLHHMDEAKAIVRQYGVGLVWSPNFSVGVAAFLQLLAHASRIFNNLDEYDVMGVEFHHRGKADSPSGTAKRIVEILLENIERKKTAVMDRLDGPIQPEAIHFASVRGGSIPGVHSVVFDGPNDTIELTHTARNREGFASGAVAAVEFIKHRKGFYDMNDMLDELLGGDKDV